jgi:hypothetical protein
MVDGRQRLGRPRWYLAGAVCCLSQLVDIGGQPDQLAGQEAQLVHPPPAFGDGDWAAV